MTTFGVTEAPAARSGGSSTAAPSSLVLAPASFVLWQRASGGQPQVIAIAWGLPILWAYILPGLGTNVFKVWEFDVRLKLGRFRPQHGFVFGSATAMIAWLVHADAIGGGFDLLRQA